LVAARSDRGGISVSKERLSGIMDRLGFVQFFETSAKTGITVADIKKAVLDAIPWDTLPFITTPDIFSRIKKFLLRVKKKGTILSGYEDLFREYLKTHPKDKGYVDEFRACLQLLEASGLVRQLSFDNLVLLQPEILDGYCAAMALDARKEPDGLGYITETHAIRGEFYIDTDQRIPDKVMEKSMLLATVEEAVARGIAIRQGTPEGMMLVFPSEIRKDLPQFPGNRTLAVAFTFDGPVSGVYATLAVSLIHSVPFRKKDLFKNAALFTGTRGGECGFSVEFPDKSNDARGKLTVFFDDKAEKECQLTFLRYVNKQLEKLALKDSVQRERIFQCPEDGLIISPEAVNRRKARGETTVICADCGAHLPMDDLLEETIKEDSRIDMIEAGSEEEKRRQTRLATYNHRVSSQQYHAFLCHNSKDKPTVRRLKEKLADQGIVSWIDETGLLAGDDFVPELEKVIRETPAALIIVGPHWMGNWQKQEYYSLLNRAVTEGKEKSFRLIPVLLPGAPKEFSGFPEFLKNKHFVDFRNKKGLDDMDMLRFLVKSILIR
ncbi:MAG: toll/interleukin-1 receptor domain-containing protein, partial [Spirochaetales bacterium]|nr:toll/interleukin-1 receptor domain-containing protein [Spirochaetales bacterium]